MCITFLFTNDGEASSNYKVILINNRDEFYARKTLKADVKVDNGLIQIYGTDVETPIHGTWLAISKREDGVIKIGNLLNLPGEKVTVSKELLKGRGPIALDFILSDESVEAHNKHLCEVCENYNSFNFLSVEITSKYIKPVFTNNASKSYKVLQTGVPIGVSNSPIDYPLKKVEAGVKKFQEVIDKYENKNKDLLIDQLMNLLKCDTKHYPDPELLKRRGNDAERFSSIHVTAERYGSRTRSIILIDKFNNIDYVEETIVNDDPKNPVWERTRFIIEDNSVTQCS